MTAESYVYIFKVSSMMELFKNCTKNRLSLKKTYSNFCLEYSTPNYVTGYSSLKSCLYYGLSMLKIVKLPRT